MADAKTAIRNAVEEAPSAGAKKQAPPGGKGGRKRSRDLPYDTSFPEACPVEPLGIHGDEVYLLDAERQLRVVKGKELNQGTIRSLFGSAGDMKYRLFPRETYDRDSGEYRITGWRPEWAADVLYNEAARRGIWDVFDRVRGPGSWVDDDGNLVIHAGDLLLHDGRMMKPGPIGRHVYPSAPPKPRPCAENVGGNVAADLLAVLRTWQWRRPDIDPVLLLGWIGAAMLGGALKWRPMIWITGDRATGKSTLHDLVRSIMGPGGMISATDASAAGLWQTVGHASLPVALDELEAEADNRKSKNIINLARHAASGGQTLRGSSDHKHASFTVRSCFMFSSILIPPMQAQDLSRMAILQLDQLMTAVPPLLDDRRLAAIGAALRQRLAQHWPRFGRLVEAWKHQLALVGHGGRGADQFGTLMAVYDLLMFDHEPHTDEMKEWGERLSAHALDECGDNAADHERCVSFLLSAMLDLFRSGERRTVASWVLEAAGRDPAGGTSYAVAGDTMQAQRAIGNIGLKVATVNGTPVLYVANHHQGLASIFRESHWTGSSGTSGVWVQALRRIAVAMPDQQRFNGLQLRCTAVPLEAILPKEGGQYV